MQTILKGLSAHRLAVAALLGVSLILSACGDKEDKEKKQETAPASSSSSETQKPATAPEQKPAQSTAKVEIPKPLGTVDTAALLAPGPLPDVSIGKPDAKVRIVEYMSMTCPHCARFHNSVFEKIKEKYIDTGKVQFTLREFPLDNRAAAAIMLARCAPTEQYFPMVSALFRSQDVWAVAEDGRAALLQMAKLAGFSQESFEACINNQKLLDGVNATREKASKDFGVDSTPTFFINGKRYAGEMSVDEMSALIDQAG